MPLKIYRNDCIELRNHARTIVFDNNGFFDLRTNILNDDFSKDVLSTVERGIFSTSTTFISRDGIELDKSCLSTGTKTLLNIIQHPDVCFDVSECGINALQFIPRIKDGIIIWRFPLIPYRGKKDCDISYNGIVYSNFSDFLNAIYKEDRG